MLNPYPAGGPETVNTETYDGTSWTEVNNLSTKRTGAFGGGTQTAAVAAGGYADNPTNPSQSLSVTEEWDGTNWSGSNNLNTGRAYGRVMVGIQTAGMISGGYRQQTTSAIDSTELYDGTSWTTANAYATSGAYSRASFGATYDAAIAAGGYAPGPGTLTAVESWDGTCWTSTTAYPSAFYNMSGFGTQTLALVAGGRDPGTDLVNKWDGISWTTATSLPAPRHTATAGTFGTYSDGIISGGQVSGTQSSSTLEFTGAQVGTQTITTT